MKMSVVFGSYHRGEIAGKLELGCTLCWLGGLTERFKVWAGRELFRPVNGPALSPVFCFGGRIIAQTSSSLTGKDM